MIGENGIRESCIYKTIWQIVKIFIAAVIALLILNIFCLIYYRRPEVYNRDTNATAVIHRPGGCLVSSTEGRGINHVDSSGYFNFDKPLSKDGYILCLGASNLEGLQVMQSENYVNVCNSKLAKDNDLVVYNMGASNHTYDNGAVSGFESAIKEFPESKAVVIAMEGAYDISASKIMSSLDCIRKYDDSETGQSVAWDSMWRQHLKEFMPVLYNLHVRLAEMRSFDQTIFNEGNKPIEDSVINDENEVGHYEAFVKTMLYMKGLYDGEIIIEYHPGTGIDADGNLVLTDVSYYDELVKACNDTGVIFADCREKFEDLYNRNYKLPYGFSNTQVGAGHLNKYGHKAIAEELLPILEKILKRK